MSKQIVIAEQHRVAAVFSEDQIQELVVATGQHQVSDIYLGVVENVLPGIDAAFVNLGDTERNGFIHVSDLGPVRLKRSAGAITELLAPQQKVLVQVMKEPTGNKGPRLTGNVSLPGRYIVLMPYGKGVNLSRRIRDEEERNRLRALGILIKPAGMGLLLRTEAEEMSEEAIIEDLEMLQQQWESIQQQAVSTRAPSLLNRDDDFIQRVLRDVYSSDVNRIVVDSAAGLKRVKQHLMAWNGNRLPQGVLIDQHREASSILDYFRVNAAIREALKPRVDLPSGGYIIIERTEALTVVDVNSGSFTRSATARETVLWTNCEAATEIARQLRLRNIAGVIIIDFIDMDSRRDKLQVLEHFNKALRSDKSRPQIAQLSELGLVELTRKRQGQNIYELFSKPCPTCGGLGHLAHLTGDDPESVGEILERSSISGRSSGRVSIAPPSPVSAAPGVALDSASDLQELDLTNHPNYQERGARRRRRGRRLGETLARDEAPTKVVRPSSGVEKANVVLVEPQSNGTGSRPEKSSVPERDRARPSRADKSKEELPEIIKVTMTPEEQDVFAFMGVSPAVLFEGEIKNPRTALIQVQVPGQETKNGSGAPAQAEAENNASSAGEGDASAEQPVAADLSNGSPQVSEAIQTDSADAPDVPDVHEVSLGSNEGPIKRIIKDAAASKAKATTTSRRRRRRSSASSARGKQLTLETEA